MFGSNVRCVLLALASFLIVACGGGGGGGGGSGSSSSPPAPPPTSIKYPASTVAYTAGVSAQTLTPKASGGPVASWSISPALPAGLSFSASTGAISGTPTAASATTSYTVTAQNSGGQVTFSLSIAVQANALVQLGHGSQFLLVRFNGSIVLAEDQGPSYQTGSNPGTPHWVLWNYATGAMVASGSTNCLSTDCWGGQFGDLEGPTVVLKLLDGFEVHTASSGQLLTTISVEQTSVSWWKLATDGSYIVAGGSKGLEAWSPSGQLLVSRIGDYSLAQGFAAPGAIRVGAGPAGNNVVEQISVPGGADSTTAPFNGTFNSWFADGSSFFATVNTDLLIYSADSVQEAIVPGLGVTQGSAPPVGLGQWFWTWPNGAEPASGTFNVYAIGAPTVPAASYVFGSSTLGAGATLYQSGTTIGVLNSTDGSSVASVSVIDLSGSVPSKVDYSLPFASGFGLYAAASASQWVMTGLGSVLIDGPSLAGSPRLFNYGQAVGLAGSQDQIAIATASGQILVFNASTLAQEGSIPFFSRQVSLSADGSLLAAAPDEFNSFTLNIYSLPSGSLLYSWPYTYTPSTGDGTCVENALLSGSGANTLLVQTLTANGGEWEVSPPTGGTPIFSSPVAFSPANCGILYSASLVGPPLRISPDATLIATSSWADPDMAVPPNGPQIGTNLYANAKLVTAISGWPVGWLDNGHLIISAYQNDMNDLNGLYQGCALYGPSGANVGSCALPEVLQAQVAGSDALYAANLNSIVSVSTGVTAWASANREAIVPWGALAGSYVVFVSGATVLAQPH